MKQSLTRHSWSGASSLTDAEIDREGPFLYVKMNSTLSLGSPAYAKPLPGMFQLQPTNPETHGWGVLCYYHINILTMRDCAEVRAAIENFETKNIRQLCVIKSTASYRYQYR